MKDRKLDGPDIVALVLAAGLIVGIVGLIVVAAINVSLSPLLTTQAIGENTTQILTAVLGGIIGILGGYIGSKTRRRQDSGRPPETQEPPDPPSAPGDGP